MFHLHMHAMSGDMERKPADRMARWRREWSQTEAEPSKPQRGNVFGRPRIGYMIRSIVPFV